MCRVSRIGPDGIILATGHSEGVVRLWDAATGKHKVTFIVHTKPTHIVGGVAYSPDGKTLVTRSGGVHGALGSYADYKVAMKIRRRS